MISVDDARRFIWTNARLIDRLRFEHLVDGADTGRVLAALRPYVRPDGGFGDALEPDFRGPVSQPTTVETAWRILHEVGRFDPELVLPAADWLASVATSEGGVPMVLANGSGYPRAPWWDPDPEQRACLLPTGGLAGLLHAHGVRHPWLDSAGPFVWQALAGVPARLAAGEFVLQVTYECRSGLLFLAHVPDRDRAGRAAADLGRALLDARAITLDPAVTHEAARPLDFAATPDSIARSWFDDATIERELDALESGQREDGGFDVDWPIWTPAVGPEWRGIVTVERLRTLRAYGRL